MRPAHVADHRLASFVEGQRLHASMTPQMKGVSLGVPLLPPKPYLLSSIHDDAGRSETLGFLLHALRFHRAIKHQGAQAA